MLWAIWRGFLWCVKNVDSMLVLLVAATCEVLHLLHVVHTEQLAGITLAVLAIIGFSIIHDRIDRGRSERNVSALSDTLDSLTETLQHPVADTFFTNCSDEKPLLERAEHEVWASQETGFLLLESYKNELISLLRRGRHVRMVVSAPTELTARLMAFRNANLSFDGILGRAPLLKAHVTDVIKQCGDAAENLEIRFIPYPLDMTCVIVDPCHIAAARREGIVRQAGFMVTYADKLDFGFNAATSPRIFAHYQTEVKRVFQHAAKVVLLTGASRSGKTRLLEKVATAFANDPHLFYVLSPALADRNKRLGFAVKSSGMSNQVTFAERDPATDKYRIVPGVWQKVVATCDQARVAGKVIVLDEIGALQLQDESFVPFLENTVNDTRSTLCRCAFCDETL